MNLDSAKLSKARSVYQATRRFLFSDMPPLDILDRLSLMTVVSGVRRIGVLEGDGLQLSSIRDAVVSHGVATLVRDNVWTEWDTADDENGLLGLLHSTRHRKSAQALWAFASATDRNSVKGRSLSKSEAGLLLGYPECCVKATVSEDLKLDKLFLSALVKEVGSDREVIKKALVDDVSVELEEPFDELDRVARTTEKYPFCMHICCEQCLSDADSASAKLNSVHEELTLAIDPNFHAALLQIQALTAGLDNEAERSSIFEEIKQVYYGLLPELIVR